MDEGDDNDGGVDENIPSKLKPAFGAMLIIISSPLHHSIPYILFPL